MNTRRFSGCKLPYTNSSGLTIAASAVVVLIAGVRGLIGVAEDTMLDTESGTVSLGEVHELTAKTTDTWSIGDRIFWDPALSQLTVAAAGNTFAGSAWTAKANGDTTGYVALREIDDLGPGSVDLSIADPGNAGAIPVITSGSLNIVTAGAETRTLAAPSYRGQMLSIAMKTDGGDCVITCATTINQTGNNTITLNDAGDHALLMAKQNGANVRWSVVVDDGATLATV